MSNDHPQTEGERRKLDAFATLEATREALILAGRRAMLRLLLAGRPTVTADDLRALVDLPEKINPKCFGAVPGALARARILRKVGSVPSNRPEAHGRENKVWELTDRAAAERWLASHPEPTTPAPPIDSRQRSLFDGLAGEVLP